MDHISQLRDKRLGNTWLTKQICPAFSFYVKPVANQGNPVCPAIYLRGFPRVLAHKRM